MNQWFNVARFPSSARNLFSFQNSRERELVCDSSPVAYLTELIKKNQVSTNILQAMQHSVPEGFLRGLVFQVC